MRLPLAVLVPLLPLVVNADSEVIGVAPKDQHLYVSKDGKWSCLSNPEIVLDWSQVNDDYCDCPDGSDEPGTSVCENNLFWCKNEGHVGSYIPSHLVNDGVCDYEVCCDGADEWKTGVQCPNKCVEIHEEYEKDRIATEKMIAVGKDKAAKIIRAAQRMKAKLADQLATEESLLSFDKGEIRRFQKLIDERDESENADLFKALKKTIDEQKLLVGKKLGAFASKKQNLGTVYEILSKLDETFNANLNDNAVKQTVEDFREFLKDYQPSELDVKKLQRKIIALFSKGVKEVNDSSSVILESLKEAVTDHGVVDKHIAKLEELLNYLIENYNPNFNDPNVKEAVGSFQDYLVNKEVVEDDAMFVDSVSSVLNTIADKLSTLKPVQEEQQPEVSAPLQSVEEGSFIDRVRSKFHFLVEQFLGTSSAQVKKSGIETFKNDDLADAVQKFEEYAQSASSSIDAINSKLSKNYGPNEIFRAMADVKKTSKFGEYDYELEIIGDVRQKGANGHNVKIGTFDRAELDEKDNTVVAYYENGAKCWNGPVRRAVVKIECGDEHELLGVSEPEKCEYLFRMRSPLGCHV